MFKGSGLKIFPIILILVAAIVRLLPHPANVAPIAALGLFGGAYLPRKYALILPLAALFLSDLVIGFYGITMLYVYGSFILITLLGIWLKNRKSLLNVAGASIIGSTLFFLITNFGVWAEPRSWYSRDLAGLIQCYVAGLPFFRNTLVGDLVFTGLFFGGYELAKRFSQNHLPKKLLNNVF